MPSLNLRSCQHEPAAQVGLSCRKRTPVIANQCAHWCGNPCSFSAIQLLRTLMCQSVCASKIGCGKHRSHSRRQQCKKRTVMPLTDGGPDLPTSRHNKTDGHAAAQALWLRYVPSAGKQVHPSISHLLCWQQCNTAKGKRQGKMGVLQKQHAQ